MANNQRAKGGETDGDELAGLGDATEEEISDAVLTKSVGVNVNGEPVRVKISDVLLPKSVTCAFMDNKFIRVVVLVDGKPVVETTEGRKYCKKKQKKNKIWTDH